MSASLLKDDSKPGDERYGIVDEMAPGELPLIRTKLAPPRVSSAPVRRGELLQQLDQRRDRKLTMAIGPAGCGKSMLLTQWRQQLLLQGASVAWFNAGSDDSDVDVAAYIVEALQQAGIAMDREPLHVYRQSSAKAWRPLVASLVNDIADQDNDVYLIIDDLHHVTSFGALNLLDRLLSLAPQRFHLVLGSRSRPPLRLARLRAEDDLTDLQFTDLRFSREEAHQFLQAQGLPGFNPAQQNTLYDMTDGWPAGLQLLAFTLRKQQDPENFFERQGHLSLARAEALGNYLETVVVEHLSSEELDFLIRICACRRFNRELCELITGDARAGPHLARFESESLFLLPIDTPDAEPWYRFHRLFASFLNERLQRLGETEVRRIHQLASHWFDRKNLHIEAMRHATLSGDSELMLQLVDKAARRMVNGANFVELIKRCEAIPREAIRSRLNVCLCLAWAQLSCCRLQDFERTMDDISHHPERSSPDTLIEVQLLHAYHFMRRDDTVACLNIVEPMMQAAPPANNFLFLMLSNIASLTLVNANEFERAREVARQRHRVSILERPDYPRPLIDITDGFSHLVQGNIGLATVSLNAYIDHALQRTSSGVNAAGLFAGYLLEAFYQSGAVQAARAFLERYLELVDAVGATDGLLFAYRVRARVQQLDGDATAARQTLLRLEEIGYQKRLDRIVAWSLQEQVALSLRTAQNASVRDLLAQLDGLAARHRHEVHCARSEIELAALLAHAMVAFEQGDESAALAAIAAADRSARANRRSLLVTRLGLMRAVVLLRSGQGDEALEIANSMLATAVESSMMRVLPDLGAAALPMIEQILKGKTETGIRRLLEAARQELDVGCVPNASSPPDKAIHPPGNAPSMRSQIEVLSPRELDVLRLLGDSLSNKSIARVLGVSSGTVKWHLKNVYGKLGAASREEALSKARAFKIL